MKKVKSKVWIAVFILIFIAINILITNLNETEKKDKPSENRILDRNIGTH